MKTYTEQRPWGHFIQFTSNEKTTVKIIVVKARQQLSLQYHLKRREFWRVLKGRPILTIGNKKIKAREGDEFVISPRIKHRIVAGRSSVEILEISFGTFDENDIVRLEDAHNRV